MIRRNADQLTRELERRWRAGERTPDVGMALARFLLRNNAMTVQWYVELGNYAARAVALADRNLAAALGNIATSEKLGWAGAYAQALGCELFLDHHGVETCPRGHPLVIYDRAGAQNYGTWDLVDLEPATWSDIDSHDPPDRITFWGVSEHHDGPIANGVDGHSVMLRCEASLGPSGEILPAWEPRTMHCSSVWFVNRDRVDFI